MWELCPFSTLFWQNGDFLEIYFEILNGQYSCLNSQVHNYKIQAIQLTYDCGNYKAFQYKLGQIDGFLL